MEQQLLEVSVRASDNRFKEGWFNAIYSAITIGLMNATTANQSTHCILVYALLASLKVDSGNKSLYDAFTKGGCDTGKNGLNNASASYNTLGALTRIKS